MQTNTNKKLSRLISTLDNMNAFPKAIIKYGTRISLALLLAGSIIILFNHFTGYDAFKSFVGTSIIKNSFSLLAEVIIGGLLIDFVFKKK
jgi:hypothetical protein